MKPRQITSAEMAMRDKIRAIRQQHYEQVASGVRAEEETDDLRVGKGPRGKFYVKRGKEILSGPFETEEEAKARAV
jgi:hypothetical protein